MTVPRVETVFLDGIPPIKSDVRTLLSGILTNSPIGISSADSTFTVTTAHKGGTIVIAGTGPGTIAFGAASGYDLVHSNVIVNKSNRRWLITISGRTTQWLWPDQTLTVFNCVNSWHYNSLGRWTPGVAKGLFCDYTNGNDANDGLAAGAGNAIKTIQEGVNRITFLFDGVFSIQLSAGTHDVVAGVFAVSSQIGHDQINIVGDSTGAGQSAYVIRCAAAGTCLSVQDGSIVTCQGVTFKTIGNGSTAAHARQDAVLDLVNCDFDAFPLGFHMKCTTWASINVGGSYNIVGSAAVHLAGENSGYINYGSFTVNIPTALAFDAFLTAQNCAVISNGGAPMTFSGSGVAGTTGTKYIVAFNGVARIGSTLPGSIAGTTSTGGQYA